MNWLDSVVKTVRGIVKLRGGTDGTLIGNTSDSLKTNITNASGASAVNIQDGGNSITTDNTSQGSATGGTAATTSDLIGAKYNTTLPTLSNGQQVSLQVDANGRLITNAESLPTANAKFSFGTVATSTTTADQVVYKTAYTERTTNAQRSIVSSSANDTSAGTGARQIVITYLDQTGAGPYTETVTLNGTTPVNTTNSDICFIENMKVSSVGSGGTTAGTITLRAATGGGGAVIGTIATGDRQTMWAHHYVPINKTCYISGFSVNNSSTTTGAGALFILRAQNPTSSTSPNIQVSDFNRLYGQASSTNTRTYLSPIQVVGPSRITAYVTPESSTAITQRASFDYIDN